MPNSGTFDPETKYVQIGERVENQARQISDLDVRMRQGFTEITSQLRSLSDEFRGGSRTQWPILIGFSTVAITILGGLGYLALQPIKDNQAQMRQDARTESANTKDGMASIVTSMVTQAEMKWRTDRGLEDRKRTDDGIKDLRDSQVPREELDRVFDGYKQQFSDQQRQIDEVKQAQGGVYGARDVILDLKTNQQRLERELSEIKGSKGPG